MAGFVTHIAGPQGMPQGILCFPLSVLRCCPEEVTPSDQSHPALPLLRLHCPQEWLVSRQPRPASCKALQLPSAFLLSGRLGSAIGQSAMRNPRGGNWERLESIVPAPLPQTGRLKATRAQSLLQCQIWKSSRAAQMHQCALALESDRPRAPNWHLLTAWPWTDKHASWS